MPSSVLVGLVIACTAAVTMSAMPMIKRALSAHGVLDIPNHRSSHDRPTVRGGGIACLLALLVVWAGAAITGADMPHASLGAAVVIAGVGFADDFWGLSAVTRLLAQVLVGLGLGATLGGPGTVLLGAVAFPVAVNAVNFMDGINGITGLTVSAWSIVVLVAGVGSVGSGAIALAAIALGQALGFLPWNVPQARVFLGDSGSYMFGALIAASLLESVSRSGMWWLVAAPMAPYLFDTGMTLAHRLLSRSRLFDAHRNHLYQRLSRRPGRSHLGVAALIATFALVTGMSWLLLAPLMASITTVVVLGTYWWTGHAAALQPQVLKS